MREGGFREKLQHFYHTKLRLYSFYIDTREMKSVEECAKSSDTLSKGKTNFVNILIGLPPTYIRTHLRKEIIWLLY